MVKDIQEAIQSYQYTYQGPSSSITSIIEEAIGSAIQSKNEGNLSAVLNSPAFHDNEPMRSDIRENELLEMFLKSKSTMSCELQAINTDSQGSSQQCTDVTEVKKYIDKIKTTTGDAQLLEALRAMERQFQEIESENDE